MSAHLCLHNIAGIEVGDITEREGTRWRDVKFIDTEGAVIFSIAAIARNGGRIEVEANPKLTAAFKAVYMRFPCNDDLIEIGWDQKRIDLAEAEMNAARTALKEAGAIKYGA